MCVDDEPDAIEQLLAAIRVQAEREPDPPPLRLPRCRDCAGEFPREALDTAGRCGFCRYDHNPKEPPL